MTINNKKATVESLRSKRLSDFFNDANKPIDEVSSKESDSNKVFEKYSIINLKTLFGTDEVAEEAPLLFVGKATNVSPTQNLQEIIESYRVFKEITSIEDKDVEDQFRLVVSISLNVILIITVFVFSSHLDKEEISMIEEELEPIEDVVAEPVKKTTKSRKKKKKLVEQVDSEKQQENVIA